MLYTEKVEIPHHIKPGVVGIQVIWIAYDDSVLSYANQHDRVAFALGQGKTRKEAIREAEGTS